MIVFRRLAMMSVVAFLCLGFAAFSASAQGRHGGRHDNGRHLGWYKNRGGRAYSGVSYYPTYRYRTYRRTYAPVYYQRYRTVRYYPSYYQRLRYRRAYWRRMRMRRLAYWRYRHHRRYRYYGYRRW